MKPLPFLLTERSGSIITLRMNRPEQRNALTTQSDFDEFVKACDEVSADPAIKVVILTGNGKAFCAGGNVKDMHDKAGMFEGSPYDIRNNYRRGIQRIPLALYELEVPVIAAINGPAIGAGLDLACMCDLRIAAEGAVFAENFVRLGIVPGDGGAWLLPRIIGLPRATHLSMTGETIDCAQALAWGLITRVVPPDTLLEQALEIAERIAENPAHSLRLGKRLLREGQHMRLDSLLELSAAFQAISHHTEDHHEAARALFEKRSPIYKDG